MAENPAEQALQAWMARQYERSPESVAAEARAQVRDEQQGPLEGPYGPSDGPPVRAASGRDPVQVQQTGPVPAVAPASPDDGPALSAGSSRTGQTDERRGTRMEMSPEVLEQAARLLRVQHETANGPPAGYRPPEDETRRFQPGPGLAQAIGERAPEGRKEQWTAAHTLIRLLEQAPDLVREAIPRSDNQTVMRARSIVIRALDDGRLWLREALERAEEAQQNQPE